MTIDSDKQRTVRDLIRRISPPWLVKKNGYKLLYSFAMPLDAALDSGYAALRLKWPGAYNYTTLGLIGQERKLRRGIVETDEGYALRLRTWWDAARHRGSPYGLIRQLEAYNPPGTGVQVVYRSGRRFSLTSGGDIAMDDVSGWNPDGSPQLWASYTIILQTDIYHTLTGQELLRALNDLRSLVVDLNAAHCHGKVIIMAGDSELWAAIPPPPGEPDLSTWADAGTWAATGGQNPLFIEF